MPNTVFFDLDETLLDFHKAEAIALSETLKKLDIEPTEEIIARYSAINAAHWALLEKGELTRAQVLTQRFQVLFDELGVERSCQETQAIYENLLKIGHYFIPGAPELLECLHAKYDLYLVSNGTAVVQDSRIKSAGIAHYFKEIFISQRVGFDKPDARFFSHCFSKIPHFSPDRAIIVGDSLTSDIRGGINSGICTCWFNPRGKARPADMQIDYEIAHLHQLPALLEQFFGA